MQISLVRVAMRALSDDALAAARKRIEEAVADINGSALKVIAEVVDRPETLDERAGLRGLSARESAVAQAVARSLSNKRIAFELGITEATVKVHIKAILRKLNAPNRTALAVIVSQAQAQ